MFLWISTWVILQRSRPPGPAKKVNHRPTLGLSELWASIKGIRTNTSSFIFDSKGEMPRLSVADFSYLSDYGMFNWTPFCCSTIPGWMVLGITDCTNTHFTVYDNHSVRYSLYDHP